MEQERKRIKAPASVNNAADKLLKKMYISNVAKRLRELNQPNDNDRRRWVWELIQNAKDTIVSNPHRDTIKVKIVVDGDTVKFIHNGDSFTMDARFGLLWKYSDDKENQESTGRFGTGFLTTHCLSKKVKVQGDVYGDDDKLIGFEVTMFRDGQTEAELLEGLNKMKASEVWYEQPFGTTTYTYHVNSDSGRQAIKLGIESLHENIAQTMLFCKELESVELDNNGEVTSIKRLSDEDLGNGLRKASFELVDGTTQRRNFIYKSMSEYNDELSQKYKADRKIRITAAIEVDDENNIVGHSGKTSFFCSLPLVGIESQLDEPLIINSPDFEPDSERQSLMLKGDSYNEETGNITEVGINHLIYKRIMPIYSTIVAYLVENRYGRLYLLASGLKTIKGKGHKELDEKWYKENVIDEYREILLQYPVACNFSTGEQVKLADCIVVKENGDGNENAVFQLLKPLYPDQLIRDNHQWAMLLWNDGLKLWSTKNLCEDIAEYENWNKIKLTDGTELAAWYNSFLDHVKRYNELFLKEFALLPNMNGDFLKKEADNFKQGENLTEFVIDLLDKLGKDVRPMLLHSAISAVSLESKYNSSSYSAELNRLAKQIIDDEDDPLEQLIPLLSIVVDDSKYSAEFTKKRNDYFNILNSLFLNREGEATTVNCILKSAWEAVDKWFCEYVLNTIQEIGDLDNLPDGLDVKWLNVTLSSLDAKTEDFNKYKVIPNQYGVFCKQETLYIDGGIPEELKDSILNEIDVDFKEILLNPDMDAKAFAISKDQTIDDVASSIAKRMGKSNSYTSYIIDNYYYDYPQETLNEVSCYLLSLLPQNEKLREDQEKLLNIARTFLPGTEFNSPSTIDYANYDLWRNSNQFVAIMVMEALEEAKSLDKLNELTGNKGEARLFELLNQFFDFVAINKIEDNERAIYPDQNGYFHSFDGLYKEDGNIDDDLKNIIALLVDDEDEYRNNLMDKRMSRQPQQSLDVSDAYKLIDDEVAKNYKDPDRWQYEDFKQAAHLLIEEWGDKHKSSVFNEDNFPKVYPDKDAIVLNVVWPKEDRQNLISLKNKLDSETLHELMTNTEEFKNLHAKNKELLDENKRLRERIDELLGKRMARGNGIDFVPGDIVSVGGGKVTHVPFMPKGVTVMYEEPQYAGLTDEQKRAALEEAQQAVLAQLESLDFDTSHACCDWCEIDGVTKNGVEFPIVVHSYKWKDRGFSLNASDCLQLAKDHSMLWIYDGGCHCITFNQLMKANGSISIKLDTGNLVDMGKLTALSIVLRWFKGLQFDFGTFLTSGTTMAEEFNAPERTLNEVLKASSAESLL